jgi:hypothetical protein
MEDPKSQEEEVVKVQNIGSFPKGSRKAILATALHGV